MNNKRINVAISGNIGIGKSTLVNSLGEYPDFRSHKEEVDRELLTIFTEQVIEKKVTSYKKVELLHQFSHLNNTIKRDIKGSYYAETVQIFDRGIFEHVFPFAYNTLDKHDWAIYYGTQSMFLNLMGWEPYDIVFFLKDDINNIYKKIEKRGREQEKLTPEYKKYLQNLNDMYNSEEFMKIAKAHCLEVVTIDVANKSPEEVEDIVMTKINEFKGATS